jgi:peroxiredoxin
MSMQWTRISLAVCASLLLLPACLSKGGDRAAVESDAGAEPAAVAAPAKAEMADRVGPQDSDQPCAPAAPPEQISVTDTVLIDRAAPDVELEQLGGGTVSVKGYEGKALVLAFWASWCGPCRHEMPELDAMWKDMRAGGVEVLGVNVDRDEADAVAWLKEHPVSFPIALDPDSELLGQYNVNSMPTTFVVDRKGVVRSRTVGFKSEYMVEIIDLLKTL